jgi:hypothetical protein
MFEICLLGKVFAHKVLLRLNVPRINEAKCCSSVRDQYEQGSSGEFIVRHDQYVRESSDSPPDVPLCRDTSDIHIVDPSPPDVLEVPGLDGVIECFVEYPIN